MNRCERQQEFKKVFETVHKYPIKQFLPITVNGVIYTPVIKEEWQEYTVVEYTGTQEGYNRRYHVWLGVEEYENKKTKNKKAKQ